MDEGDEFLSSYTWIRDVGLRKCLSILPWPNAAVKNVDHRILRILPPQEGSDNASLITVRSAIAFHPLRRARGPSTACVTTPLLELTLSARSRSHCTHSPLASSCFQSDGSGLGARHFSRILVDIPPIKGCSLAEQYRIWGKRPDLARSVRA